MINTMIKIDEELKEVNRSVADLLDMYIDLMPVAKIADTLGMKKNKVVEMLDELQLRRPKKYRRADYASLQLDLMYEGETDYEDLDGLDDEVAEITQSKSEYVAEQLDLMNETLERDDNEPREDFINDIDGSPDIDELNRQLNVKNNALNRQRLELNRLRQESREKAKNDEITDRILERFDKHMHTFYQSRYNVDFTINERPETLPEEGLIAVLGDMHLGSIVKEAEVAGNSFNYKIAYERLNKYIDKLIMHPMQSKRIHVVNLYDNLQGIIHGGLEKTEESFIDSVIYLVDLTVHIYSLLSEVYDEVIVHSTGSNHERLTGHITHDGKQKDYGRLVDEMVSRVLTASNNDKVTMFVTDHGYQFFNVNGANVIAFHGDTLRTYKYASDVSRAKLQDVCLTHFNKPYRHAISGHTHTPGLSCNQYNGVNITNGSLIGATPYGVQSGFSDITPVQTIAFIGADGALEDSSFVNLRNS